MNRQYAEKIISALKDDLESDYKDCKLFDNMSRAEKLFGKEIPAIGDCMEEVNNYDGTIYRNAKAIPHNSSAALAMPFLPSASCRNLDLPPVNLRFLQSHLTKNAFAIAPTHLCGIALK